MSNEMSRAEAILNGDTTVVPQSRIGTLLKQLREEVDSGGATDAEIAEAVSNYLAENPVTVDTATTDEVKTYVGI